MSDNTDKKILENSGISISTYTGNGTGQTITGLGFKPSAVLIKNGEWTVLPKRARHCYE